jgi:hypothetical protein
MLAGRLPFQGESFLGSVRPVLAMVLVRGINCLPKDREMLSLLDPEAGKTIRDIKLPDAGPDFPG